MPPRISWRTEDPRWVISKNLSSALGLPCSTGAVSRPESLSAIFMDHLKLFDLVGRNIVVAALRLERAH
ncbi:hypothetical protein [Brevibacterium casei]|uniref:hypothetical protein n=1 Tax=Brevibacterium casei TaxID=33889 RepID=UPI001D03924B|nr:hypothetical protein [Brevibacterium casei]